MERTRCGAGLGQDADLLVAAEQAAADARVMVGSERPDLAAVFVCGHDPDDAAAALTRAAELTGARTVLGCTAPGVIGRGRGVEMASAVSVFVARLPDVSLRSFHLEVLRTADSIAVLGLPPQRADQRRALLLADHWSFPADGGVGQAPDVLRGLTLSGGLAVGLHGAGSTRLLVDGVVHDRGAVGVVLGGDLASTAVVSQGCRPVGPVMTVTAADGNAVLELAGIPAITKLEEIVTRLPPEEQALVSAGVHLGGCRSRAEGPAGRRRRTDRVHRAVPGAGRRHRRRGPPLGASRDVRPHEPRRRSRLRLHRPWCRHVRHG